MNWIWIVFFIIGVTFASWFVLEMRKEIIKSQKKNKVRSLYSPKYNN